MLGASFDKKGTTDLDVIRLNKSLNLKITFFFWLSMLVIIATLFGLMSVLYNAAGSMTTWILGVLTLGVLPVAIASTRFISRDKILKFLNASEMPREQKERIQSSLDHTCLISVVSPPTPYVVAKTTRGKPSNLTVGVLTHKDKNLLLISDLVVENEDFMRDHLPVILAHEVAHLKFSDTDRAIFPVLFRPSSAALCWSTGIAVLITTGLSEAAGVFFLGLIGRYLFMFLYARSAQAAETRADLYASILYSPAQMSEAFAHSSTFLPMDKIYRNKWKRRFFDSHPYLSDRLATLRAWDQGFNVHSVRHQMMGEPNRRAVILSLSQFM